jgi:signal transduction histidine kinase
VQFWIGDLIGIVVTTPVLLLLTREHERPVLRPTRTVAIEALGIAFALWIVFGTSLGGEPKLFYVLFLPVIWIAMRHGIEGGVIGTLAVQLGLIAAIVPTRQGGGTVLDFQFLMLAVAATGLLLGAAVSERRAIERQLRDKQTRLDRSLRLAAASELASALAHELNQPLSAITNYLKGSRMLLARDAVPHERVADAVERAAAEALRAGDIIRRLREFVARGETERSVESLPKLVEEASALALVGAKEYGIRVHYDFSRDVDLVLADKVQIQQVVLNLVRNAVDAMADSPSGRRELIVALEPVGDDMAQVSVTDTGPGIDPEIADQLFRPFITTKRTGMGVGLSISRTIVEAHGGRIWAEPHPGGGARFGFTLHRLDKEDVYDGE